MSRIITHDVQRDFWNLAIIFITKDPNELTKADIKFLESHSITRARQLARYDVLNAVEPLVNTLPEYRSATMLEFLENIDLLASALGFPLLKKPEVLEKKNKNHFFIDANGAQ